jgi:hypothetical protein
MVVVIDQGKFDVYFEMFVYPVMIYRCPINFDSSSSAGFRMVFDDDDDLLVVWLDKMIGYLFFPLVKKL